MKDCKIVMDKWEDEWDIEEFDFSMSITLHDVLSAFPTIYDMIELYGYEDGHHFVVESAQYLDENAYWVDMTSDELDELMRLATKQMGHTAHGRRYDAYEFITNRIDE